MMSVRSLVPAACALSLALGLGACRSNPRYAKTATPAPTAQAWPNNAPAPSQRDLDDAKALAYSASKSADDATARAEAANQETLNLAEQLRAEQDRTADMGQELADVNRRLKKMEATPPAGGGAPASSGNDSLTAMMVDLQSRSQAEVLREGNLLVVRVTDAFKAGSDSLKSDVQLITTLNATAAALMRNPAASVSVVGHTDGDPINKSGKLWRDNDHLSQARAERVAQVLASNGVQGSRISVEGRGFRDPLSVPEANRADKARNRRVEILIRM